MGIRAKLFWLYLITFGLMASIASWLLLSFLQANFNAIEQRQTELMMAQLLRNFATEITHLNDLNTDWGNWDGLYFFAKNGTANFDKEELSLSSLISAKVNLMSIIDAHGKPLLTHAIDLTSEQPLPTSDFQPVLDAVIDTLGQDRLSQDCGIFNVTKTSLLLCWQPIRRTNHSGEYVGSLLMARVIDEQILDRLRNQSALDFDIQPIQDTGVVELHKGLRAFQAQKIKVSRASKDLVTATLTGLTGNPALQIQMHFSDEVSRNGNQVIRWVMAVLLLVVALTGGSLIMGIHVLLVRRIQSFDAELNAISASTHWTSRLSNTEGNDELSNLGKDVNQLLGVIDQQVLSLEALSLTDALTQIANRRAFDLRLAMELDAHARTGLPLALLALDVDFFKLYNDNYGHPAGDVVLKALSDVLRQTASRPTDLPARVGGEEFAILLPNTSTEGAAALAERLREKLAERNIPHAYSPVTNHVTVSIGVTVATKESPEAFISRADRAVYLSKSGGRDRVTALRPESADSY